MKIILSEKQIKDIVSSLTENIDYAPGIKRDILTKMVHKMNNRQEPLSRRGIPNNGDDNQDKMFIGGGDKKDGKKDKHSYDYYKKKENAQRDADKRLSINDEVEDNNLDYLYNNLKDDEDIRLSDDGGPLMGKKVTKREYLGDMLREAIVKKDWGMVSRAILYLELRMK